MILRDARQIVALAAGRLHGRVHLVLGQLALRQPAEAGREIEAADRLKERLELQALHFRGAGVADEGERAGRIAPGDLDVVPIDEERAAVDDQPSIEPRGFHADLVIPQRVRLVARRHRRDVRLVRAAEAEALRGEREDRDVLVRAEGELELLDQAILLEVPVVRRRQRAEQRELEQVEAGVAAARR